MSKVVVVGAGGIGAWVVLLAPPDAKLWVYDDDIVEGSNLNRTPFLLEHIGMKKVEALADLIERYSLQINMTPIPFRVSPATRFPEEAEILVDVTDKLPVRKMLAKKAKEAGLQYVGLGYDGFQVTIFSPEHILQSVSFDAGGYHFVPSYVAPPVYLASRFWAGLTEPGTWDLRTL